MAFRVGQKVVCVDAACPPFDDRKLLQKDAIYTIAACGLGHSGTAVALIEVSAEPICEAFQIRRFRPVVSTDTGMAILEQIRRDVTNRELRPICIDEQA